MGGAESRNEGVWPVPIIDPGRCTGCRLCVEACPTGALAMQGAKAIVASPEVCLYTGHCELICPADAISRPYQIVFADQPKE